MKASLQLFPSSNKPEVVAGRVANHSKQCTWGNRKAPQHPQKPQACTPTLQILALKLAIAKPREAELPPVAVVHVLCISSQPMGEELGRLVTR